MKDYEVDLQQRNEGTKHKFLSIKQWFPNVFEYFK